MYFQNPIPLLLNLLFDARLSVKMVPFYEFGSIIAKSWYINTQNNSQSRI